MAAYAYGRPAKHPKVYAIFDELTKCVKVGFTSGPVKKRLANLQTACAGKLKVLGFIFLEDEATARRLEDKVHHHCRSWRMNGEWFRYEDNVPYIVSAWVCHDTGDK